MHGHFGTRGRSPVCPRSAIARWGIALALIACGVGCSRCGGGTGATVVAEYAGGNVTEEDVRRESSKLPPSLRAQFESAAGRREFIASLVDKRLLVQEATRRGMREDPEVRRQVAELEERLMIQALLAAEEKSAGPGSEAELRAWYDGHRAELAQPERVLVGRVLAAVAPAAPASDRAKARARAEGFASRLRKGEPFARVAETGQGPEKARNGELGLLVRGGRDPRLEAAAFALRAPGELSPVVECADGYAVLRLVERRESRVPSYEEVRAEVANRFDPTHKRKTFDALLARLRQTGKVHLAGSESKR